MIQIKDIKKRAKKSFKKNYWASVFVCIIAAFLVSTYNVSTSVIEIKTVSDNISTAEILNSNQSNSILINAIINNISKAFNKEKVDINQTLNVSGGFFYPAFDALTKASNSTLKFIKGISGLFTDSSIILLISVAVFACYHLLVSNMLIIGRNRFFMESRLYEKTNFRRITYCFHKGKYWNSVKTMFLTDIYLYLWNITIIGGIIKMYSYRLVPYIIAENPNLKPKEVIKMSREMMNGYKWKSFLLDLSFIGWNILESISFGIVGLLYSNPYKSATDTELYFDLRKKYLKNHKNNSLEDKELTKNNKELMHYPGTKPKKLTIAEEKFYLHYDIYSLILFFFTFSFVGWAWECLICLVRDGIFVNRGVLFGPWLPIYGSGCLIVLLLLFIKPLKPYLKNPMFTFTLVSVICAIIEYGTGWYLEVFKHAKWWDYSGYFLNINGRICLEGTIFFGIGGSLCIYVIAPLLYKFYKNININVKRIICIILVVLFAIDFVNSKTHPNTGKGITTSEEKIVQKE